MSSQCVPELLGLAPEIIELIMKQVEDKDALSNIRLVCKTLERHAAKELFKTVYLNVSDDRISSWNNMSQHEAIRKLPRHAIIHTRTDIEDQGYGAEDEDRRSVNSEDSSQDPFDLAVAKLSQYPNIDHLEIGFTEECTGSDHEYYEQVREDVEDREIKLQLFFQTVQDRAKDQNNKTIRKLTILNLQNATIEFTSSDLFRSVMSQLEELHVSITQEYNEPGPDHDYDKEELQTFPSYFCDEWLKPIAANLRSLSIYNRTDNWGLFPGYFDLSDIAFPKLQTLALGYYTFAHDNDLDWILAIKSLKKLTFQNCMINSWIRIYTDNLTAWDVQRHDWTRLDNGHDESWEGQFSYSGKWNQYFDRIAGGLPNLVDFRFDAPYWRSNDGIPYGLKNRDAFGARIFPQRYICFDNGILPTHWPEANDEGKMHSWLDGGFPNNLHKENLETDQKSLDDLLEKLKLRL